jgi:hypothetical protein
MLQKNWAFHLHVSYYDVHDVQHDESERYMTLNKADLLVFEQIVGYDRESERNPFWHSSGRRENNATNVQTNISGSTI